MELVAWAEREARARLSRPLPRRWVHVQSVAAEASRIGTALGDEARVLVAAAVLHDVGYAPGWSIPASIRLTSPDSCDASGWTSESARWSLITLGGAGG